MPREIAAVPDPVTAVTRLPRESWAVHDWNPTHRLGAPRRGPLVSPRLLDVGDWLPDGAVSLPAPDSPAEHLERLRLLQATLVSDGWTVEPGGADAGTPGLVAERDLRMDLTALRRLRLIQVGLAVEFASAIALGFLWPMLGHPGWQGEAIIALAAIGAFGIVGWLARVDFVSLVLVVTPAEPDRLPAGGASAGRATGRTTLVGAARVLSRNWEVLGDRGGRKLVDARRTPASDAETSVACKRLG
ncbi:MAG: hypothetical protein L3K01_05735 [Thermoplasmata archaeon]|nr:hypothetical protein [Thermoplasmata archaeon]